MPKKAKKSTDQDSETTEEYLPDAEAREDYFLEKDLKKVEALIEVLFIHCQEKV